VSLRPGERWGTPASGPPDAVVQGGDADLAAAVVERPGMLVRYEPLGDSDLARTTGLVAGRRTGIEVPMDALVLADGRMALSTVVVGVPPDRLGRFDRRLRIAVTVDGRRQPPARATTVVVATGQYLRGLDLSPRGHPGDGRAEVQLYALRPGERAAARRRLAAGTHLPHPRIHQAVGREVEIVADDPLDLEVDGEPSEPVRRLDVAVEPGAYRLLL
jgi:diacylglycerol kinase family enzyme